MSHASLTILAGPRQGEKIDLNRKALLIGSFEQCQIRPAELGLPDELTGVIAKIVGDRHGYTIEPGIPQVEVLVNGLVLSQTHRLEDQDVIGLAGKPDLISFRGRKGKAAGTATDQEPHRALHVAEIANKIAYVESMLKRVLLLDRETSTRVKASAVFIGLILLVATLGFITNEYHIRTEVERMLELTTGQQQQMEELRKQFEQIRQDVSGMKAGLEGELTLAERISVTYGPSICLIEANYGFADRATGKTVRMAEGNENGIPIASGNERFRVSIDGTGAPVEETVIGTGFLVAKGYVLTNLHVARPWWKNEVSDQIISLGFQPRTKLLYAYFPISQTPFSLELVRSMEEYDLGLCLFNPGSASIPTPPLASDSTRVEVGQSVVLLGYPAGVEALLARLDENVSRRIMASTGMRVHEVTRELAQRGLVRPLVTQGHISALLSSRIVHDAATTTGGSGGPLFNRSGQVIGINYAMFTEFAASNLAVPIRWARQMLNEQGVTVQ